MESVIRVPDSLMDAIRYFSDPETCVRFMAKLRWLDGPECPSCKSKRLSFIKTRRTWTCLECRKQFSVKVGTIFEDSAIGLDKWLCAMWMIANDKNGVSSYEVGKAIGITQKSAWFLLHRIRYAMRTGTFAKLSGQVEVDESFIGGKSRNMHREKRARKITGTGGKDKTVVMGMVERGGEVRAFVVDNRRKKELQKQVREHVEAGSAIFSDELKSYDGLESDYQHAVINHAVEYVNGNVHTKTMENFWSLLKRGLHGTYVSVEPFHLARYIDEQAFRYNKREATDADRFVQLCSTIADKRLTWNELTGKNAVER